MKEKLQDLADKFTLSAWDVWVERGGLEAIEQTLGPVKEPPNSLVFESGWKLGFAFALESIDQIASRMRAP